MKTKTLVVDLDGTLVLTDTLHESLISLIKCDPLNLLRIPFKLKLGKAGFKKWVSEHSDLEVETLPYRKDLITYLTTEKENGTNIVLATAAYAKIAHKVANYLALFDEVLSTTDCSVNLKGKNKLIAIQEKFGDEFTYIGDNAADLGIWEESQSAIIVGSDVQSLSHLAVKKGIKIEKTFENPKQTFFIWLKAIRLHQWLKNILLFIPILTAFEFFHFGKIELVFWAFLTFSLGASATYILNDLWDLNNDRKHYQKSKRPFALGVLPIYQGGIVSIVLLAFTLIFSFIISWKFAITFVLYLILTTIYSLKLKKIVLVDIIILSILYTLRIIAGGIVANIPVSYWLMIFSIFIFLSLATVKRCAELVAAKNSNKKLAGRGYVKSDLDILYPLGVSSFVGAVILFGLYINDVIVLSHYKTPELLWGVQILLIYILGHLWIETKRGLMNDDPVVYLIKNKPSILTIFLSIMLVVLAKFL
ncbi:UbiA family prenyltransferase [Lonepinella sp. MS14436]|uniref:UbiA family prenyltransferase n=1 Tax=Lonepinella sp. MS14436 TaxID=3003619 RepID=UPI0036DF6029